MERKIRLVAFDMDGVLTNARNSWTVIHDHFGTNNETALRQFIRGEIDDHEFIRRDVALWTGKKGKVHISEIHDALAAVHASTDAREVARFLKQRGIKMVIVTGGVDVFAERIGREIGVERVFANGLVTDEKGYLTGKGIVGVPLKNKDNIIRKIKKEMCIDRDECVSIGDSFIDVPMFNESRFGIAVRPLDEEVRKAARYSVKDLVDAIEILRPII
jgi:phosphoserine phosphatase